VSGEANYQISKISKVQNNTGGRSMEGGHSLTHKRPEKENKQARGGKRD